jgi:putative N6-adenine-specific DNA methylase
MMVFYSCDEYTIFLYNCQLYFLIFHILCNFSCFEYTRDMQNQTNLSTRRIVLTCQSGLESLVKRECERLGCTEIVTQDRLISCTGTDKNLYELLIWSRFSNRVYIELTSKKIEDFDTLYDTLSDLKWSEYLTGKERIIIEASSTRSTLESIPTLQSVGQRAIFSTLNTPNTTNGTEVHVLILIIDNIAHILLDITGDPLHKRGYRREAGEAPIKENLAAGLVAFANWKYSTPLIDPMCGSGTIAIEAIMIARNIAPGLYRHFRVEELRFFNTDLFLSVQDTARSRIYPSGKYTVLASDITPEMIQIAK